MSNGSENIGQCRLSEEDFEDALQLAHVGSWVWRVEDDLIVWSRGLFLIFGLDPDAPPPRYSDYRNFFTEQSFARLDAALRAVGSTGTPYELELELVRQDGDTRWVIARGKAQRNEEGRIARLLGTIQDITERKQVEGDLREKAARADDAGKALAESEQRYRIMGETIPFGVWWCNPQGGAEYVSPSFLDLLDMTLEEQREFGWTRRLVSEDVEPMMKKWLHCIATGEPWDHEHRVIDRHGKIHTVLSRGLPVRNEKDEIIAWVGVNLDITARKQIEQELRQAKEALEEALQVKDQFVANISHELRTPLTLILGPVHKLLLSDNLTEGQRRDVAVVERNAQTLLRHVNDLLDLSKLDAGQLPAEYAEVELAWLARFVASHFESIAAERNVAFDMDVPESLPAQVDAGKVQRVLFNLLSNALKFTPPEGRVRFSLRSSDGTALFAVEDTGPGVPADIRDTIFERFRQGDSGTTRRFGGTGLGLAIVKEFVTLHGGTVSVMDAEGGGARFVVELPVTAPAGTEIRPMVSLQEQPGARDASEAAAARRLAPLPQPRPEALPPNAALVLVVEDNPEMNEFIVEALSAKFRTAAAFDGKEGVEKAAELIPDLIVSDIMMPTMSGEQLVREVRRNTLLDDVPILLLSAKADENLRVKLLKGGAQDYLLKPFVTEELMARVEGLVSRKRKADAALRQSHALLTALTEGITDAVFVKDEQSRYLMINGPGARRLGKTKEEILCRDDSELFDPATAARISEYDLKVMADGQPITFEEERALLGETRTYLTTKAPHRDIEGRIIGIVGISHDITERKRAEEALRRSEERYHTLFNEIDEGFCIIEMIFDANNKPVDYRFTETNPAFEKHTGLIDAQGKTMREFAPSHEEFWFETYGKIALTGESVRLERRAEQFGRWYDLYAFRFGRPEDRLVAVLFSDITERKTGEQKLKELVESLERSNRELAQFVYVASHDLREPLRQVTAFVQLLEQHYGKDLDEAARVYMGYVSEGATRMNNLIVDLLAYSRVGMGTPRQKFQRISLEAPLKNALDNLRVRIEENEASITWDALPVVTGDPTQLALVFQNLIDNSLKFRSEAPPVIHIASRRDGPEWIVTVTDNGIGFDPSVKEKVFQLFQRLHPREAYAGTGIGLTISKRIIERHGGRIWAESSPGRGAVFSFTLPADQKDEQGQD